ncbi:hypothetical protein HRI_000809300 [Hibiscus trionum]|uniref:Reverse transcriptase domain-containing protein n=1 Tax=Hibiscus trionum TaxID=183268 RepID=A0A9W7H5K5_HIBTR|nr:hypothetical protein HRI_000809300 [Hibiscus trionum]
MAIKVYLEKAFDRLHWGFIEDSLIGTSFPMGLRRIIMECVKTSIIQVQWKCALSHSFQPERGLRQGDPLSPHLFVLAMERLSHLINHSVAQGSWDPFRFFRHGLVLSHVCFADDLILYTKEDMTQAQNIHGILIVFGTSSGHRVSKRKTTMYFSPNTDSALQYEISSFFGFQIVDCLEKYLGVLVLNRRAKCSDYDS